MSKFYNSNLSIHPEVSQTINGSSIPDLLACLRRNKARIDEGVGASDDLCSTILLDPDLLFDPTSNESRIEITDEQYHNIMDSMLECAHPGDTTFSEGDQFSITGSDGKVYCIQLVRNANNYLIALSPQLNNGHIDRNPLCTQDGNTGKFYLYKNIASYDSNGRKISMFQNLLSDLASNNTLNTVWSHAAELVTNFSFSIEAMNAFVENEINDRKGHISEFLNNLYTSFSRSGLYGAIQFLLRFITTPSTAYVHGQTNSLSFDFSDNNAMVPQQYIVGLLQMVVGGVVLVAGVIVSIFSKVLGMTLAILGSTLLSIPRQIAYDYQNATKAGFFFSENQDEFFSCMRDTPFAFFQGELDVPKTEDFNNQFPCIIPVVGGSLWIGFQGPGSTDNNHKLRIEFHPSIDYHEPTVYHGISTTMDLNIDGMTANYTRYGSKINPGDIKANGVGDITDFSDSKTVVSYQTEDNANVLQDYDDRLLRLVILHNIGLYYLQVYTCNNTHPINDDCNFPFVIKDNINNKWFIDSKSDISLASFAMGAAMAPLSRLQELAAMDDTAGADSFISWANIINLAIHTSGSGNISNFAPLKYVIGILPNNVLSAFSNASTLPPSGVAAMVNYNQLITKQCFDAIIPFPRIINFQLEIPKYDRGTFAFWCFVFGLSVAAIAISAGVLTYYGKAYFRSVRAKRSRDIESAWSNYVDSGNSEDYEAYVKLVKKNNISANLISGTKYSKEGYWSTDSTSAANSNGLLQKLGVLMNDNEGENLSLSDIRRLIRGS